MTNAEKHEMMETLKDWKPDGAGIDRIYDVSRKALDEATHLTEYEDGKASRVLTAIAFLSGLAGGLYGAITSKGLIHPKSLLVYGFHGLFLCFALLIVAGALQVVFAIRPRFNLGGKKTKASPSPNGPPAADGTAVPAGTPSKPAIPRSFLFSQLIVQSTPVEWANAFLFYGQGGADRLKTEYIKNHIVESYLIAEKVIKKLRPLSRGIWCFLLGMGVLCLWLMLTVYAVCSQSALSSADATQPVSAGIGNHHRTHGAGSVIM